jgi:hypothetical protein
MLDAVGAMCAVMHSIKAAKKDAAGERVQRDKGNVRRKEGRSKDLEEVDSAQLVCGISCFDLGHDQPTVSDDVVASRGCVDDGLAHDFAQDGFRGAECLGNCFETNSFAFPMDV